jgi:hypothetical protein
VALSILPGALIHRYRSAKVLGWLGIGKCRLRRRSEPTLPSRHHAASAQRRERAQRLGVVTRAAEALLQGDGSCSSAATKPWSAAAWNQRGAAASTLGTPAPAAKFCNLADQHYCPRKAPFQHQHLATPGWT